jgi:hypothetical protein
MQLLFLLTFSGILTVWFMRGLLNPYINVTFAIIRCAIESTLTLFFKPISVVSNSIEQKITKPIRRITNSIHIPKPLKALFYLCCGVGIFYADQKYGKTMFNLDETIRFYQVAIMNKSYWVSEYAIWVGGFCIGLASLYILVEIFRGLNKLLDHPIGITVVVLK